MATTDAFLVGENWISEHYFGTEATSQSFHARILERRKQWDAEESDGHPTARTRFAAARGELVAAFATITAGLTDDARDNEPREAGDLVRSRLIAVLGLDGAAAVKAVPDGDVLTRVSPLGATGAAPLVIVAAEPVDVIEQLLAKDKPTLHTPTAATADGDEYASAARLTSALFVDEHPPDLVLVLAGRWALLAERERWPEGRYLAIDLQAVSERNDTRRAGEVDRMLTCLAAESVVPDAGGDLWWRETFDASIKHTVGVSADLREGIRLSIEILANDVVTRRAAQGLEPLPADQAQPLARQALRFLYRILFLLYAEASPELGVLPTGVEDYEQGYGLDRLRDLVQVELTTPQAVTGTHLYESLATLFRVVERGHGTDGSSAEVEESDGLTFQPLRSDLFRSSATALIDDVRLGNAELQRVLRHLLLSKEKRGRDRGFISYSELGINQLGAVYEGLMSYTGFFATTDLYEVAKNGDASKGSWVVGTDRIDGIRPADFVQETLDDGRTIPVLHKRGTFVFRLAGRERQQSASYYTPEVLTRFTVGQALAELLDQDGTMSTAAEILDLTVCEPALGSGAFAIEAVRQLAGQYLDRRQAEVGTRIDPEDYPLELQRVKAYLALHNVYGVDLNATAVELAEISLWLDTMGKGLSAPWFGLHLRRGNSLIGARRATYTRTQVSNKAWLTAVPVDAPLSTLADDLAAGVVGSALHGGIHHFLLPAEGWGAATEAKEAAALVPDDAKALRDWRRSMRSKPTKKQLDDLGELAYRVEVLWQFALRRLQIAEQEIRRAIPVWGANNLPAGGRVQREQIEAALADADGAYQRLRRVMDAWCALWFWPLTDDLRTVRTAAGPMQVAPPTLDDWIAGLQALLGRSPEARSRAKPPGNLTLGSAEAWDDLNVAEIAALSLAGAAAAEKVLADHTWLVVCERVAAQQGFFHWHLDFAPVFANGGFDLQVGNPPWVRPRSDVDALLAEGDPWWQLEVKPSEAQRARKREETLSRRWVRDLVVDGITDVVATAEFLGSLQQYPLLEGLQPDSYRCFMIRTWGHASVRGIVSLLHPESHFTDEKAGALREATFKRLRRHWQFLNELVLFEIDHHVSYGVHVYGAGRAIRFAMASSLYHPDTVERSFGREGLDAEPGLKDSEGNWDLRPHPSRIITVDDGVLATWHAILENGDVPVRRTRMVYTVNRSSAAVLDKLALAPRIGELGLQFSAGWHEKNDRTKGFFESSWGAPESWRDVILQGPHLHVATPMYKTPNKTMLHNLDWSATDFETLAPDAIPVTAYKPTGDQAKYDASYTHWTAPDGTRTSARDHYRIAWRRMAANTGERTLIAAIVPPGAAHVHPVHTLGLLSLPRLSLVQLAGFLSSLVLDSMVRSTPKSEILFSTIDRLPFVAEHPLAGELTLRVLRLSAVTGAYADLWEDGVLPMYADDQWAVDVGWIGAPLSHGAPKWTADVPLRSSVERRQALVEIDALVALMLGVTADELCTIYRTQFAVLYGYDHNVYFYDVNGRLVPNSVLTVWRKKRERITVDERTATNQAGNTYIYELPFATLDREADIRQAYAEFERRLAQRAATEQKDYRATNDIEKDDSLA